MICAHAGVARSTNIAAANEELVFFASDVVVFDFSRLAYHMYASLEKSKAALSDTKNPPPCKKGYPVLKYFCVIQGRYSEF